MNKILKIIIKNDPIFKYIVEDYPFYDGIFFHSVVKNLMKMKNVHYRFRSHQNVDVHTVILKTLPKFSLKLKINIKNKSNNLVLKPKFTLGRIQKFEFGDKTHVYLRSNLRIKMRNRNKFISFGKIHMIKATKLKTHDPFTLKNRDILRIKDMDGDIII